MFYFLVGTLSVVYLAILYYMDLEVTTSAYIFGKAILHVLAFAILWPMKERHINDSRFYIIYSAEKKFYFSLISQNDWKENDTFPSKNYSFIDLCSMQSDTALMLLVSYCNTRKICKILYSQLFGNVQSFYKLNSIYIKSIIKIRKILWNAVEN